MNRSRAGLHPSLQILSPELQIIIALLSGQDIHGQDVDWHQVGRCSVRHRIFSLLHRACSKDANDVPQTVLADLLQLRRRTAIHGALGILQRDNVLRALEEAEIPALGLKGSMLAQAWYGELSLRPFSDLDILLPASQIQHAQTVLHREGYSDTPGPGRAYHVAPMFRTDQPCSVELHHRLVSLSHVSEPSFDDLYERAMHISSNQVRIRTLGSEDTLLHLCLHLLLHMASDRGWTLLHICDLARHVEAFDVDWTIFVEQAEEAGVGKGCAGVLGLATLLTGADVPEAYIDIAAGLRLLPFSLPEHGRQAEFLSSLMHMDYHQAVVVMTKRIVQTEWPEKTREIHPSAHVPFSLRWQRLWGVLPGRGTLRKQAGAWLTMARHWDQSEQVVMDLLSPDPPNTT